MKKISFLLFLIIFLLLPWPILAASATPSASISTGEIQEKIKQRLEKNASGSGQTQEEEKPEKKYFAWVGEIIKTDKNTIYIDTDNGEKQAKTDDQTTILQTLKGSSRKEVTTDKLEKGYFVLAMGTLENEVILAKRVIVTPAVATSTEKRVLFGKASEIEDSKITIKNAESHILEIGKNTKISANGQDIKAGDIQVEDKVYSVNTYKDDKYQETIALFVVPGKNNPDKDKKDASPSASISD